MPPAGAGLGAKGRGKAKAKGKGRAKAEARAMPCGEAASGAGHAENGAGELSLALVARPKAKAKATSARKRILESLAERPIEDVLAEAQADVRSAQAMAADAASFEEVQSKQADKAFASYTEARDAVAQAIEEERCIAEKYMEVKRQKQGATSKVDERRTELAEVQKRVAFLEIMVANQERMREVEERRKAAADAAEEAKRQFLAQKQAQKHLAEASRRALEEARLGKARGVKRAAPATSAEAEGAMPASAS